MEKIYLNGRIIKYFKIEKKKGFRDINGISLSRDQGNKPRFSTRRTPQSLLEVKNSIFRMQLTYWNYFWGVGTHIGAKNHVG